MFPLPRNIPVEPSSSPCIRAASTGSTSSSDSLFTTAIFDDAETHPSPSKRKSAIPPNVITKRQKHAFTQHERFWAADGNALLQINTTRFKVHRSRLATNSQWFDKLFERRSGLRAIKGIDESDESDEDEYIRKIEDVEIEDTDGHDLYLLDSTGVTVVDFEVLLSAMDDAIDFYHDRPKFQTVASIFRAASIFKFYQMTDFAKRYLNEMYSDSLENMKTPSTLEHALHAAEAVVLGRHWNLSTILKRAFYELAMLSNLGIDMADEDMPENEDDPIHRLDSIDLVRLLHGQKKLMAVWIAASSFAPLKCGLEQACSSGKTKFHHWDTVVNSRLLQTYRFDPIRGIQHLVEVDWMKLGYCSTCNTERIQIMTAQREALWEAMDDWFVVGD
ncbi:hypothetical protein Hypma_002880 [Hypsizygus marmoreus]|uniref:BTB domain-containing protein n=1 Tax=Hypsizygus marmoreus TaxID=39966 RepID=A0A369JA88_HYPMA|nr:hypothetical protein Hypma_002880 [Hypsizygus marmoreus]